jgi:hypothetical protein
MSSEIGYFEGAIRPDVDTFRESIKAMEEICVGKEDQEVYMYCTGKVFFLIISNKFYLFCTYNYRQIHN